MKLLLPLLLLAAQDPAPDPAAELKSLQADYRTAETEFFRPYREAKTDEERKAAKLDYAKHPAREFLPKFEALAGRATGTEAAAGALLEVIRLSNTASAPDAGKRAVDSLVEAHIESPLMESLALQLRYGAWTFGADRCDAALSRIAEKSPHAAARAAALYVRGATLAGKSPDEARKLLETVGQDYPDSKYAARAEGYLYELDHLTVGKTAPDFETTDQDGKAWKLSDYRGKIVVVDFWGFW